LFVREAVEVEGPFVDLNLVLARRSVLVSALAQVIFLDQLRPVAPLSLVQDLRGQRPRLCGLGGLQRRFGRFVVFRSLRILGGVCRVRVLVLLDLCHGFAYREVGLLGLVLGVWVRHLGQQVVLWLVRLLFNGDGLLSASAGLLFCRLVLRRALRLSAFGGDQRLLLLSIHCHLLNVVLDC